MGTVLGWGTQDVDLPCYDDCWCLEWTKEVGVDRVQLVVVFFPMHLCWLYFRSKITEEWFSTLVPLWNHQEIKKTQTLFILGLSCSLVIRVFQTPGGLQSMGSLRVGHDFHFSLSCIGEGNGNPLQCSCLENPRDGGAWWAAIYGVAQSRTWLKWLSSSSGMSEESSNICPFVSGLVYCL